MIPDLEAKVGSQTWRDPGFRSVCVMDAFTVLQPFAAWVVPRRCVGDALTLACLSLSVRVCELLHYVIAPCLSFRPWLE